MRTRMNLSQRKRRVRGLVASAALTAVALTACGGDDASWPAQTGVRTQAAAVTEAAGTLHVIWGDPLPGAKPPVGPRYLLTDEKGGSSEILIDEATRLPAGGVLALNRRPVRMAAGAPRAGEPRRHAEAMEAAPLGGGPEQGGSVSTVTGSQRWMTIMCRFADSPTVTPHDSAWFSALLGSAYPGMDHYFRELSYNAVNLDRSGIMSRWVNLPHPRAHYVPAVGSADLGALADDCTAAVDGDVFFPNFVGVNLMFNQALDGAAWGGSMSLTRDGQSRGYSMTWMPPWGYENHNVLGQEMGHGFGLPHSSGPYTATYDSQWDVMSGGGTCNPRHATYGCPGVHTVSYHKDLLGWIPAARKRLHQMGTATITLEQLGQPAPGASYLMAQIPIAGSSTQFYTVEARRLTGYDDHVPGAAVVIHKVDTSRGDRVAQVVDADNNGNPNDAGAMWLPGETFSDPAAKISVAVNSATATGFVVTLSAPPVEYTRGDFNGDGRTDMVVTTDSGSYWYFSNGDGTWTVPYARADLRLGTVAFTPGDFDYDGLGDLVITTAAGSSWYFSRGGGTWDIRYPRPDLTLGTVSFTAADFNRDRKTDLVITTPSGSYWYFSTGRGTWNIPYSRGDLPLGSVAYTPGDFNGDGKADLVVTNSAGSFWYFSDGSGAWNVAYTRVDLRLGTVAFTAGDFSGDLRDDIVITTSAGSDVYYSIGTGIWDVRYRRPDLTLGTVAFSTGDFNADRKVDLVITTPSGSWWYLSGGVGAWNVTYNRADLTLGTVAYAQGDFNADRSTDLIVITRAASHWYFANGDGTFTQRYLRTDLTL